MLSGAHRSGGAGVRRALWRRAQRIHEDADGMESSASLWHEPGRRRKSALHAKRRLPVLGRRLTRIAAQFRG